MKSLIVQIKWWRTKENAVRSQFNAELYVKVCEAKLKLKNNN